MRIDLSKAAFYCVVSLVIVGASFVFGLYAGYGRTNVFLAVNAFLSDVKLLVTAAHKEAFVISGIEPTHFLQPSRYKGAGVTINRLPQGDKTLVLMAGFFDGNNQIRLIRRDGSIVAKWPLLFGNIFKDKSHIVCPPQTDWNVDIHGCLILPNGSVVFNFEYCGLVKVDRFNKVVWTLPRETHHSVELAADGGYWVCSRRTHFEKNSPSFPPFVPPYQEDTILQVSENGKIIKEISVPKIFYDNGLEALITATGEMFLVDMCWDNEIVHLNKVAELPASLTDKFPIFRAGDLIISLRKYNLIVVFSPETGKIKWWKTGPWIRQHDPEFTKNGTIIAFNNNTYRAAFGVDNPQDKSLLSIPRVSNILAVNPSNGKSTVIYGCKSNQKLLSVLRGKVEAIQDNGLLITEFEGGRVLQTNAKGDIVWEYINRYNDEQVAEITEARVYPADYFTVEEFKN